MNKLVQILHWTRGAEYGRQRLGQALMNSLFNVDADLYFLIDGTDADCFYQDEKVPAFLAAVTKHIEGEN